VHGTGGGAICQPFISTVAAVGVGLIDIGPYVSFFSCSIQFFVLLLMGNSEIFDCVLQKTFSVLSALAHLIHKGKGKVVPVLN
jgi:hypothetical protein